jgi:hypothetical protein
LDAPATLLLVALQLAALQVTSFHSAHSPAPSHAPVLPQLACDSALHAVWPSAGFSPAATSVQTPR